MRLAVEYEYCKFMVRTTGGLVMAVLVQTVQIIRW